MTSDPARTRIIASEADVAITQELPKGMAQPLDAEILMGAPHATDPAATLNAAAARLRELAGAATPGPWHAWDTPHAEPMVSREDRRWAQVVCIPSNRPDDYGRANAAYIAAMSPPVALALADLLEQIAHWIRSTPNSEIAAGSPDARAALAVARLVLGESL